LTEPQRALAKAFWPLADHTARRFARVYGRNLLPDFMGAALEALCRAAGRFDPSLGVHFGRYAKQPVTGACLTVLRKLGRQVPTIPWDPELEEEGLPASPQAAPARKAIDFADLSPAERRHAASAVEVLAHHIDHALAEAIIGGADLHDAAAMARTSYAAAALRVGKMTRKLRAMQPPCPDGGPDRV
jgi:hypothetical protein